MQLAALGGRKGGQPRSEPDRPLKATCAGLTTTLTSDKARRKKTMDDPDMSYWTYTYDGMSNQIAQMDARSCTTTLTYDLLSRHRWAWVSRPRPVSDRQVSHFTAPPA